MTSSDTIFSSSSDHSGQQRWANQISKTILETSEISINIPQSPPSIFKLPQTLISTNPQSYTPHKLALGPYHHFNPHLYKLQWLKLAAAKNIPNPNQTELQLLNNLKQLEPRIRNCYNTYLDIDTDALAWIFVIDGIFLLTQLRRGSARDHVPDILMVENQMPLFVLTEIEKTLGLSFDYATLRGFAEKNSPLQLKEDQPGTGLMELQEAAGKFSHLLDYMYKSIVRNESIAPGPTKRMTREKVFKDARKILDAAGQVVGLAGAPHAQALFKFVGNLPCEQIFALFGKSEEDGDENSAGKDVGIPSVSKLTQIAKVNFCVTPRGIRDIDFKKEELNFYLPVINLNVHSEVVLRNLLAYEVSLFNTPESTTRLELAEYVELMSGIIKTEDDVKLLNEKGIVKGDLGYNEVVKMFTRISELKEKGYSTAPNSRLGMTIQGVSEEYESRPEVKRRRFLNMCGSISWKLLTIILLALMIFQSFCAIYGCSKLFPPSQKNSSHFLFWQIF